MKKILTAMMICLVTGALFAQTNQTNQTNVTDTTCFCCSGFYNLPTPQITGPAQVSCGDKPQYSIKACPGATITWSVFPALSISGNGTNTITLNPPLIGGTYAISVHVQCGHKEVVGNYKIVVTQLKNCVPDFTYTATLLASGSINVDTRPNATAGAEHYWGIVYNGTYPNCTSPCTAIPLATILSGGTWGAHETATGVFNVLGMGTGTTAGTTGYGINYSGFPNCACFKITHYINCCGQWLKQTACVSFCTSNMKLMPGSIIKPLSSEISNPEIVEEKDLPAQLRGSGSKNQIF